MLVRHDLSLVNAGWLLPVSTFSLRCTEMFPKDLLPNLTRDQSKRDRAVVLWIVLLDFFEDGCNICVSSVVRDLTPSPWPCNDTLRTPGDIYLVPWTWADSDLTISS